MILAVYTMRGYALYLDAICECLMNDADDSNMSLDRYPSSLALFPVQSSLSLSTDT